MAYQISILLSLVFFIAATTYAAKSFAASNLYYAAGLSDSQQQTLFYGLQSANVKVLRVWLDGWIPKLKEERIASMLTIMKGQSESQKGTDIDTFPSLQGDNPDSWNDTVLNRLDDFMHNANQHGIKLQISIHSYNALSAGNDFYGQWYGTGDFYTSSEAMSHFKDRIAHVLDHVNPHNGKAWSQSSEYIFAFEAQNEAMHEQVCRPDVKLMILVRRDN
jgi:mannan endo-1,4-beta-mannosidase